jgi:hypothetical protein
MAIRRAMVFASTNLPDCCGKSTAGTARSPRPASMTELFAWLVMSADLIMGSEVGTPATQAFDIIVMWIVEPQPKAVFSGLLCLSNVVFYTIVDCDLPLRDRPNVPCSEWGASCLSPLYRAATRLPSEILDGYTRPFPSQFGQERNAGTFE